MPHRKVLTPEDDLFGRVALFNELVTLDAIIECARTISAEIVAGRPQRSLATMLILKGHLTSQQAGTVEAALRKQAATKGPGAAVSAGPTPKPKPMKERAPAGTSQISVAVGHEEEAGPVQDEVDEATLQKIIARIAPGRIYPEMLDHIVRKNVVVIDVKSLAKAIQEPEKEVVKALKRWLRKGVLRKIATYPYNFSPTKREEREIRQFLNAWHDPKHHARVLGYILACE